jgi:hypothetical protein
MVAVAIFGLQASAEEKFRPNGGPPIFKKIAEINIKRLIHFPKLKFRASTRIDLDPRFLKLNPSFAAGNGTTSITEGYLVPDKYKVATYPEESGDAKNPPFTMIYNGKVFYGLTRAKSGVTSLSISNVVAHDAPGTVPLGTMLLAPYSFLFPTEQTEGMPVLIPAMLTDRDAWERAFDGAKVIEGASSANNATTMVKMQTMDGGYMIVGFADESKLYPTKFERYDKDGYLSVRYKNLTTQEIAGSAGIEIPKTTEVEFKIKGFPMSTLTTLIESVDVLKDVDASEFEIDPTSVDSIWDLDQNIRIPVRQ